MLKQATASLLALSAATVGVDASVLNEKPVHAEYQLKEHVSVVQRGDVVEATLPWKDQVGLKVKYDMGTPTASERVNDKRNKQVVVEQMSTDAFKIDVLLNEKPDTNQFCYTIEGWEDYDFFYQPALTPEEIAEGASRPEEIVGSYAVYHKTLKNHRVGSTNYETGKVAHIPYPYIWSVNATSTKHRAEAFDITDGRMCVTVAQSDLDTMEYPVRIDPTLGYTSIGASETTIGLDVSDDQIRQGLIATSTESGSLISIDAAVNCSGATSDTQTIAVFVNQKDSIGANSHGQIATVESSITVPSDSSFQTFTAASESLDAVTYIINIVPDGTTVSVACVGTLLNYDATTNAYYTESFIGTYASSKENPWTDSTSANRNLSIYATYTASGGSTPLIDSGAVIFE